MYGPAGQPFASVTTAVEEEVSRRLLCTRGSRLSLLFRSDASLHHVALGMFQWGTFGRSEPLQCPQAQRLGDSRTGPSARDIAVKFLMLDVLCGRRCGHLLQDTQVPSVISPYVFYGTEHECSGRERPPILTPGLCPCLVQFHSISKTLVWRASAK